ITFALAKNPSETFSSCLNWFKIFDSLILILESWREVSSETIVNCYKKTIKNSFIDVNIVESIVTDLNDFETTCFAEIEDDECFLEEVKEEFRQQKFIGEIKNKYIEEEGGEHKNNEVLEKKPTH
ncbi:hypothetical protein DMUE_5858, partial [Dictyocoela muelleri]